MVTDVPEKLTSRQRDLVREFGESCMEPQYPRIGAIMRIADEFYAHKEKIGK